MNSLFEGWNIFHGGKREKQRKGGRVYKIFFLRLPGEKLCSIVSHYILSQKSSPKSSSMSISEITPKLHPVEDPNLTDNSYVPKEVYFSFYKVSREGRRGRGGREQERPLVEKEEISKTLLPGEFRWFASSTDFWRFLCCPVITEFNIAGVRAVAAVNHSGNQAVSIDFIYQDRPQKI